MSNSETGGQGGPFYRLNQHKPAEASRNRQKWQHCTFINFEQKSVPQGAGKAFLTLNTREYPREEKLHTLTLTPSSLLPLTPRSRAA